jgi:hypothetical protein
MRDPDPDPAYHFDADPDAAPDLSFNFMRIHEDPDPQHCWEDWTCFMLFSLEIIFLLTYPSFCST